MKIGPRVQRVLWFVVVLAFLTVVFTLTFFLTSWVYKTLGKTPSPLGVQIINSVGGLFLTGVIISTISYFLRPKMLAGEMRLFRPIIEALERMAKGDFSVRVDHVEDAGRANGFLGELVNSVNQAALELNQMETMRQEFISNVSHELQSPLTSIRGFAQALQNDQLTMEDRHHYLTIIETESVRLSKLTDNLLKLASLEAEHAKFEPITYRLDKQIRSLILACEPQWASKNIEMDVELDEATVNADEDLLSQVWVNLIHNSIKFTPNGGSICIGVYLHNDLVRFEISDTGAGISEADRPHVFERFYKADKSRTRSNNGGSGLGLSIAQKIIEMHQGTITVESKLSGGTTFLVSLPTK